MQLYAAGIKTCRYQIFGKSEKATPFEQYAPLVFILLWPENLYYKQIRIFQK